MLPAFTVLSSSYSTLSVACRIFGIDTSPVRLVPVHIHDVENHTLARRVLVRDAATGRRVVCVQGSLYSIDGDSHDVHAVAATCHAGAAAAAS
ncbi:hypothetical protein V8E53_010690 [Lactarius tabidus]